MKVLSGDQAKKQTGLDFYVEWESMSEAIAYRLRPETIEAPADERNRYILREHESDWGNSWADKKSRQDLLDMTKAAQPSTLGAVRDLKARITRKNAAMANPAPRRQRARNQDMGDEFDAALFVARRFQDPNVWETMKRPNLPQRVITLAVDVTVMCYETRDALLYRGAALLALVEHLAAQGYSVTLKCFWRLARFGATLKQAMGVVTVKAANQPINASALATALAEISFARKIMLESMVSACPDDVPCGWGQRALPTEKELRMLGIDILAPQDITSPHTAETWLTKTIDKLARGEGHRESRRAIENQAAR